jgi:hypothetical protein
VRAKLILSTGGVAAVLLAACAVPPKPRPPVKPPVTVAAPACPTPAANGTPGPDSNSPISSWGVDGTAYASVVIGNVVYVGGVFKNAVSPTGAKVARTNLAAFCLANGTLLNSFVANTNAQVWGLTTDGANLYVGGDFTKLDGQPANRLLKLNPTTGGRVAGFNPPAIPHVVYAVGYFGGNVYVGGDFSLGTAPVIAKKGASFNASNGAFSGWNPDADARIESLKVSPDGAWVYVGGSFDTIRGAPHDKLARTARVTGAVSAVRYGEVGHPGQVGARVFSIAVAADSVSIFAGTGPAQPHGGPGGNRAASYASDGSERWHQTFNGDIQAMALIGSTLYTGFHGGFGCTSPGVSGCNLRVLGLAAANGAVGAFKPSTGGVLGVRSLAVATGGSRLVAVGDFTAMGSTKKLHGVAIFN